MREEGQSGGSEIALLKQEVAMWREEWRVRVMECSHAKLAARLAKERYQQALNAMNRYRNKYARRVRKSVEKRESEYQ